MVEKFCERCGASFRPKASKKRRFCSRACIKVPPAVIVCPGCSEPFAAYASAGRAYCSKRCEGRHRSHVAGEGAEARKKCRDCGQEKPLSEFTAKKARCKPCVVAYCQAARRADPERFREYTRRTYAKHREAMRVRTKQWIARNPEQYRALNRRCGEDWKRRHSVPLGRCETCDKPICGLAERVNTARYCSHSCCAIAVQYRNWHDAPTSIEAAIAETLIAKGIAFETQVRIGQFLVDILLPETRVVIECHGDFWHANPATFPDGPIYPVQKKRAERDARLVARVPQLGYGLVVVWEKDIAERGALVALEEAALAAGVALQASFTVAASVINDCLA